MFHMGLEPSTRLFMLRSMKSELEAGMGSEDDPRDPSWHVRVSELGGTTGHVNYMRDWSQASGAPAPAASLNWGPGSRNSGCPSCEV